MKFSKLSPADVLFDEGLQEYQRGIDFFYHELVNLNVDIYIVEKILQFPFNLFVGLEKMIFFSRVVENFLNMGILTITKIATDKGNDLYTIKGFRNRVFQLVRPEFQDDFRSLLRQSRFDKTTEEILERAQSLRNGRIAHATRAIASSIPEQDRVDFEELRQLRDEMNHQLDVLSFNTEHMMLPLEYSSLVQQPVGTEHTTDIEEALDGIARNSTLLNLPEQRPSAWQRQRARLTEGQVNQLNQYRRKFDLPEL